MLFALGRIICAIPREQLSDAIFKSQPATCDPLKVSPWIAMSLLIKSTRRGHEHLAMRAAVTLLRDAPEKLWRRIGGLAFEEVGLADMGVTELTRLWEMTDIVDLIDAWEAKHVRQTRLAA